MRISRREFLKYCSIAAGALGLTTTDLLKIEESFAKINGTGLGPHVVWIPGQACTGCTMSLTNTIKEREVDDLLLFDIDLDYNEQLCAAAGAKAVEAAVSAIGKITVLAIEGAIPSDEHFCTIWTRTGGILAYGSQIAADTSGDLASNGYLVSHFTGTTTATTLALAAGDVIKTGSELVGGTTLPTGTIFASAADRKVISDPLGPWGINFNTDVSSSYGTDRTNANIVIGTLATTGFTVDDTVTITGGTNNGNSNGQTLTQGSVLAGATVGGTTLAAGTIVSSSFDRLWLENLLNNYGDTTSPIANTNWVYNPVSPLFSLDTSNNWATNGAVTLLKNRAVSGPMTIVAASFLGIGTQLKAGTRVTDTTSGPPSDQAELIADSGIATLFDGYGGATGTVYSLASDLILSGTEELVLQGDVTLPPLNGGLMGQTAETDKTMLHECKVFGTSAAAILCIGTCSSFGGIPAAAGNRTGASGALYKGLAKPGKYNGVLNQFAAKIRNIGGCPPHSDWIVGTIAYIIATNYQLPPTEAYGRPIDYYGQYQCNAGPCEWRYNQGYVDADETSYDNPKLNTAGAPGTNAFISSSKLYLQKWANSAETATLGKRAVGCIGVLGCKGRKTKADCSLRRWNADQPGHYGTGWCVASGAGCHGCTEPTFPDKVGKFFNFA